MKDVFWFKHDSNARNDIKIQALRHDYGVAGYGMFFMIIEIMRESDNNRLPYNKKFSMVGIARDLGVEVGLLSAFIESCINDYELFVCDCEYFWSESLNQRLHEHEIAKEKRRIDGAKGGRPKKQAEQIEAPVEDKPAPKEFSTEKTNNDYEFSNEKTSNKKQEKKPVEEVELDYCDDVMQLVNLLSSKMTENNPNCKLPSDFKKWYNEIRLMIDKDGYTFQQIYEMVLWCQADSFWRTNILSADKLRKQAGKLILLMQKKQKPKEKTFAEEMQELMDYATGSELSGQTTDDSIIDVDCVKL